MKSQLLVEFETGKIIATAVEKGKTHDFKLLKRTRLAFLQSQLCLADGGYQGFGKLHKSACTPILQRSDRLCSKFGGRG